MCVHWRSAFSVHCSIGMYCCYWRAESLPFKNVFRFIIMFLFSIWFVACFVFHSVFRRRLNWKLKSLNNSISNTYHQIPFGFQPLKEIQFFLRCFIFSGWSSSYSICSSMYLTRFSSRFSSKTVGSANIFFYFISFFEFQTLYLSRDCNRSVHNQTTVCYEWITLFYYLLYEECGGPI